MTPTTRSEAQKCGAKRYFTGKPCPNGHTADRQTSNATCVECAYARKAIYYGQNPEARKEQNAKYYAKNSEFVGELNLRWRVENDAELRSIRKRHYEINKGRYIAATKLRKSWIRRATPPWADLSKIADVYMLAQELTLSTGVLHHVDHEIPLRGKSVCGLHVHYNLRPVPATENLKKGNRHV